MAAHSTACLSYENKKKVPPRGKGLITHYIQSLETKAVTLLVQYLTLMNTFLAVFVGFFVNPIAATMYFYGSMIVNT